MGGQNAAGIGGRGVHGVFAVLANGLVSRDLSEIKGGYVQAPASVNI